ncbi:hypothetical protein EB796_011726 [Bugula neritina]|uniref:Uncharacterized protein n=1 Tax=Bugula neritina TaxID=10212 RepID=A0A7J7JUB5_BUGNE|nr:hypothetical protein EB796_011726 [Bugula neritina]
MLTRSRLQHFTGCSAPLPHIYSHQRQLPDQPRQQCLYSAMFCVWYRMHADISAVCSMTPEETARGCLSETK